jgi:hypothetical protein
MMWALAGRTGAKAATHDFHRPRPAEALFQKAKRASQGLKAAVMRDDARCQCQIPFFKGVRKTKALHGLEI